MALWTDLIDPATLSGYIRESLASYEASKGSLARWLPNREVPNITVRFVAGQAGLVPEAQYRAYDAEPEMGKGPVGKRVTIELPAISQKIPVSEYDQLRVRGASDVSVRDAILKTTDQVARAISDRTERMRATVLRTGKATASQTNFFMDDDFGRDAGLTLTAGSLWSTGSVDRLGYLQTLFDLYVATNGVEPGAIVSSTRVFRALQSGTQFQTQLINGAARPPSADEVQGIVSGAGLPQWYRFDRRTASGLVLPDDVLLLLPAPGDTNGESELGATFWGQTLTSTDSRYGIEDVEQPGVVAGVYRNDQPPMIAEVIGDAINLPVLANANLSLAAKVL